MKRALLIAGGGTLGTYTAKELLRLGHAVDVICPEEKVSEDPRLRYIRSLATEELLCELFKKQRYDGIVNFLHYTRLDDYKRVHPLLIDNTDHLIFLSSYRVYADMKHPITEDSPRLYDTVNDKEFLENEDYAVPKSQCEDFLKNECAGQPWTVVRPVISFSEYRLDLYVHSKAAVLDRPANGEKLYIPASSRYLRAGLDWAGNSGKLIAHLLFKPNTFGECYTVSSAQNLTWDEVAGLYGEETGVTVEWCTDEEFYVRYPKYLGSKKWMLIYDRMFDRVIDNSKILEATGLTKDDLTPIREGIKIECARVRAKRQTNA